MPAAYIAFSRDVKIQPFIGVGFLCEEMTQSLKAVAEVAPPLIDNTLVVTAGRDGVHSTRSLHYSDRAFDIQWAGGIMGSIISTTDSERRQLAVDWSWRIKQRLGHGWDVLVETTHIHIERDLLKGAQHA